ncbi:MAG: hypothetical protein AABW56_03360 [Nanoarchaeota archaeon]
MSVEDRFKTIEEGLFANRVAQILNERMALPEELEKEVISEAIKYFDSIIAYNNLLRFSVLNPDVLEGLSHEKDFLSIECRFRLFTTEQYIQTLNNYINNLKKIRCGDNADHKVVGEIADYFTNLSFFKYQKLVKNHQKVHYLSLHKV